MIIAIVPGYDFGECIVLVIFQMDAILPDILSYVWLFIFQDVQQGSFITDGIVGVPFFEVVGCRAGNIMLKAFFRGGDIVLYSFSFFFQEQDMALVELLIEAVARGRGVAAVGQADEKVVFYREALYLSGYQADQIDIVGAV